MHFRILHQWCLQGCLIWNRSDDPEIPEQFSIKIRANALLLSLSDVTIQALLEMVLQFSEYYAFVRHRCRRPQDDVMQNPAAWWQHAGYSIVHEIGRVCSMKRHINRLGERRQVRLQYDRLYSRYRRLKRWNWRLGGLFFGMQESAYRSLQLLEQRLSTVEVAEFRWWSWAQYMKHKTSEILFDEVKLKLMEIYNLLGAEKAVSVSPLQWMIETAVECPKVYGSS